MSTPDTTTATFSDSGAPSVPALPDYAPVTRSALGPAFNDQGHHVGRVERNPYWVTGGTYTGGHLGRLGHETTSACARPSSPTSKPARWEALATIDPMRYFQRYGQDTWAVLKGYVVEVTAVAAAPSSPRTPGCGPPPTCSPRAPLLGHGVDPPRPRLRLLRAPLTGRHAHTTNDKKERPDDPELTTFGRIARRITAGRYVPWRATCAGDDARRFLGDGRPMAGQRVGRTVRRDRVQAGTETA